MPKISLEEVYRCLQNAGFDSPFARSNGKASPTYPQSSVQFLRSEHTFVDVMDRSNPEKKVRVIIELHLRGEFEMARTHQEYDSGGWCVLAEEENGGGHGIGERGGSSEKVR
ncbi:uncharacterized protein LOC127252717 [Andrographis paniculata]|uniref:uncharacterized protein LOC127252717 n=1 Tax=Andrographis paniculata TaxID=175694 RepID=UPI0021E9060A|nr:uncharacterized protein LOC127252717 [Andrographis paniculata]